MQEWIEKFRIKWAEKKVVTWFYFVFGTNPPTLMINELRMPKELRGKGLGSRLMNELVRFADKKCIDLIVSPSLCYGASSLLRLKKFYRRFGFRVSDPTLMKRKYKEG